MEDRKYIEMIASGSKTKGDIERRLESYTNEARIDFCMKLYGRIPMGDIAISETYDKDGHDVVASGITPKQEREKGNLIEAIAHIESVYGFDTWEETNIKLESTETIPERQQNEETLTLEELLPKEVKDAENGLKIFEWSVGESLFTMSAKGLEWCKSKALYGCFVELVSAKLGLRLSNNRIPWKRFEFVSNHDDIKQAARDAVNYARNKSGEDPVGSDKIKDFLNSL